MNQHLQNILNTIQQDKNLSEEEKNVIIKSLKDANKEFEITSFKLDRTEKVKRTTAILLEETIEELEQKRIAVEAQNRELEIESSLERVRTVAMSMNNREDMLLVCRIISEQLASLKIKEIRNVQTAIFYEEKGTYMNYEYYAKHDKTFVTETIYTNHKIATAFAEKMLQGRGETSVTLITGNEKVKDWLNYQKNTNVFIDSFLETANSVNYYWFSLGPVALGISTYIELNAEELKLFKRFLNVFELAYRRFLDIENAEAQSREAQIQLALERVRARSMAMQHSNELAETSSILFQQIKALGFETWSCGFFIWQENDMVEAWMGADAGGLLPPMIIPYKKELTHNEIYKSLQQEELSHEKIWNGKALEKHYAFLKTIPSVALAIKQLEDAGLSLPSQQCYYAGFFNLGYLLLITKEPNKEFNELSKRFAKVFEQTYTRFLDLQKAEAQTKEAQIETALERVRSRTMGMQKSEELSEVIKVVYQQLTHLKINLDHAGFVVNYSPGGDWHFWIADEQDIPAEITHPYFESVWANQFNEAKEKAADIFTTNLNFEEKNKFYSELLSYIPGLSKASKDFYLNCPGLAASTVLFENVSLYIENFAGNPYSEEDNATLMRFGKVFQQTYTRFLDLQKAEAQTLRAGQDLIEIKAARKKAEEALSELRSTQTQLIQSEKMASLGELTAGIAHEIQNPLNFVNNFSEVNNELIEELKSQKSKLTSEEQDEILHDIFQNNEKINHHGKRADAIVKGMLQHSRSSSGKKEPTDINALCEEYLRLAYHGVRAKDNSFNATLKTDFDESIGNINIIPQDIGRAVLNLITNAFYAVDENKKACQAARPDSFGARPDSFGKLVQAGYAPTVSISTKKVGSKIQIAVTDNGNGIPDSIREKIFQPFFTTKPTGQGTGLGLSLAYDIITKGHNGALKVETKEKQGSVFIVTIPV